MTLGPKRRCVIWAALVVMSIGLHGSIAAQVLPLVVENHPDEVAFWWNDPATAELSLIEQTLVDVGGSDFVDPRVTDVGPVSRLYQTADLSETSARNLAEMYDAEWILMGTVESVFEGPVAGDFFSVASCRLSLRLVSVQVEFSHNVDPVECFGQGQDLHAAREEAYRQAALDVVGQLQGWWAQSSLVNDSSTSPTIILEGLQASSPLVAFKGDLRVYRETIADVREVWASEGQIGLQLDLQIGGVFDEVVLIIETLADDESLAYLPMLESRNGETIWVRLEERESIEAEQPDLSPTLNP